MMTKTIAALLLSSTALITTAAADESVQQTAMPTPSNTLELTLATGLAHATGDLGDGLPSADDRAHSGLKLETSIGWRATKHFAVGAYLDLGGFGDNNNSDRGAFAGSLGVQGTWHFAPTTTRDPWISLGTGVKLLALKDGDDERNLTGVELARIQAGLDFRISPRFALAPMIAASASMFNNVTMGDSDDAMSIRDKQVNWTFSAGILGRFDQ
jgi:hypothetical protein